MLFLFCSSVAQFLAKCQCPEGGFAGRILWVISHCIWLQLRMLVILPYNPDGGYLCFLKIAHSSTQTKQINKAGYLFEGCYFGAIMGCRKKAKIKCL